MSKKTRDGTVQIAWITGCFGCAATVLAAIVGLVGVYIQAKENRSVPTAVTVIVTTAPPTSLQVINKAAQDICYLYIVPSGSKTWGEGRLGVGKTIPPNKFLKYPLETGMYNLRAANCAGETIAESLNTHLQGEMSWVVQQAASTSTAASPETTLNVINNGSKDICHLYIVPSESANWGNDLLNDANKIPPGQSLKLPLETGMYNLRAEDCTGEKIAETLDNHLQGSMEWNLK